MTGSHIAGHVLQRGSGHALTPPTRAVGISAGASLTFLIIQFREEIGLQKLTLIFFREEDVEGKRVTRACACILKVYVLDEPRTERG